MFNLILPIAGESSRYPNTRPKWMLCHPKGNMMLTEAIRGLHPEEFDKILIIGLKNHEKLYSFSKPLLEELKQFNKSVEIILLPKLTKNQPETIYRGIKKANIKGGIFIKDCDNYFKINKIPNSNCISVIDLNKIGNVIASNKSYVALGKKNTVVNIVEKDVISNLFCCGGYYFESAGEFCQCYKRLQKYSRLYVSHIIYQMILDGKTFFAEEAKDYSDWGTLEDWMKYREQFATIFVDLDGVLVENSSKHFQPKWGTTKAIQKNVKVLNALYDAGKVYIIITTARTQKPLHLERYLKKLNIKYHKLITGIPHAKRILINDYASTNSYPSAIAINLKRNNDNLEEML